MAEHSTETHHGRLRSTVHLQPGERVVLCRCFKSQTFPFCDGAHKTLEGQAGPVIVEVQLPPSPSESQTPSES